MNDEFILKWKLNGHTPEPIHSLYEWANWIETTCDTKVARTELPGDVIVSTVFLGVNYAHSANVPPILFETMVFGGEYDQYIERYSTWDDAEAGHQNIIELICQNG